MRQKITNKLISIGVPASFKGFTYICDAMEIYAQDESYLQGKTCKMYKKIAEKHKITYQC